MTGRIECCLCGKHVSEQGYEQHCQQKHGGRKLPACPYCGDDAELVGGDVIYPHRRDLKHKRFYLCNPCGAYVGCHPNTIRPLGRLADHRLRKLKQACHAAFDPLWRPAKAWGDHGARRKAYRWLAETMRIPESECHFGMFDIDRAIQALEILDHKRGELIALFKQDRAEYLERKGAA